MVRLRNFAIILLGCSFIMPILALLAFFVDLPDSFKGTDAWLSVLSLCGIYCTPPGLGGLGIIWANPLKRSMPLMKLILWLSLVVGAVGPALCFLILAFILWDFPGGFSLLQDYYSLWYGHAAPGFFVVLLQTGGIIILALLLVSAWILKWRKNRLQGSGI